MLLRSGSLWRILTFSPWTDNIYLGFGDEILRFGPWDERYNELNG
jgi:hypothetical protein